MPITYREPQKRRQTLPMLPHLYAYKKEGEEMGALRLGLDLLSLALLKRLAEDENVQDATWFSVLADRLLNEPQLAQNIHDYQATQYPLLPPVPKHYSFRNYTIPTTLREALESAAASSLPTGIEVDKRGVTGPWLRVALAYCGFVEKHYSVDEMTHPFTQIGGLAAASSMAR